VTHGPGFDELVRAGPERHASTFTRGVPATALLGPITAASGIVALAALGWADRRTPPLALTGSSGEGEDFKKLAGIGALWPLDRRLW
jgi:hypothetical protein